ncbi:NAD(P)/FAD-dependent oxidoreductase [Caproicibacter fermentans]|nr:NAD(P)/FAD-dependent oxidoreductase [Caproicibacter fermentans]
MKFDVLVIGAGAAGMMAAGTAAQRGLRVCLLEKNQKPGRKIGITGKGRCNLTNHCSVPEFIASVPTNGRFLYGAASRFSPYDTMSFFENLGVPLKTERGNRVFPQSDKAADVVGALERFVKASGAQMINREAKQLLISDGRIQGVSLKDGSQISAQSVVVCCGGKSYPATGSTGDGYLFARQAGHTVTRLRPSLVPLVVQGTDCKEMMGLSLKNISISVKDLKSGKIIYEDFGELLFTHFGLSGPVILSASAHLRDMSPGRYRIAIDLKPALSPEKLDARLVREFRENQNRDFENSLSSLLPRAMIPVAVRRSGIEPHIKCNLITREIRHDFASLLKSFSFSIEAFRPIEEAVVTSGGVSVREVDPKTMQSKLIKGLYFAGEVLDVDAYTGGYNLQIAFSTGRLAGNSVPVRGIIDDCCCD